MSLHFRRLALCHRKKNKPPSSEGYFATFEKEQSKNGHEIRCGRPIRLDRAVPASLFDETLSQFQYDLTQCNPSPKDILSYRRLRAALTEIFPEEPRRRDKLIEILREEGIIPAGSHLNPNTIGKYTTDGDLRVAERFAEFLYYVQELKNECSTGGAEPYFECIHYWWAHVRRHIENPSKSEILDRLNFPAILLIHMGVSCFSLLFFILTQLQDPTCLSLMQLGQLN
jgi:hypothetical protein